MRLKTPKKARVIGRSSLARCGKYGWDLDKTSRSSASCDRTASFSTLMQTIDRMDTGDRIGEFLETVCIKILVLIDNDPENKAARSNKNSSPRKLAESVGTKINFIEWWTPRVHVLGTPEKTILLKRKSPHWDYDRTEDSRKDRPCPIHPCKSTTWVR